MEIVSAIEKGGRLLPIVYHVTQMEERERWYAALVAAENEEIFANALKFDVGYTGKESDKVIVSAKGCKRLVSKVTIEKDGVVRALDSMGWDYHVVNTGDSDDTNLLHNPYEETRRTP